MRTVHNSSRLLEGAWSQGVPGRRVPGPIGKGLPGPGGGVPIPGGVA